MSINSFGKEESGEVRYRNVKQDSSPQIYLSSLIVFLEGDSHKFISEKGGNKSRYITEKFIGSATILYIIRQRVFITSCNP